MLLARSAAEQMCFAARTTTMGAKNASPSRESSKPACRGPFAVGRAAAPVDRDDASIDAHLALLRTCQAPWKGAHLPLATPPGARYPYVYPRDLAAVARAYDRLGSRADDAAVSRELSAGARFLMEAQAPDGSWGQRYDLEGRDRSIYHQEDNTAHAVAVLARHVRHERRVGQSSDVEADALAAIARGLAAARSRVYRKGINLYYSTTSIHESAMERGYTLWTNGAYRDALRLASEAAVAAGRDDEARAHLDRMRRLDENLARHFVQDGQWIRRLTAEGRFDRRPDVTLLAPFYFQFEHLAPDASARSAARVENELWDPDLGLLQRYLPFREDKAVHLHAGNGPWLAYSAWLAQRHASRGDRERGRELLRRIFAFATPEGHLPEHVSTRERFLDFMENEWETGLDFRKEFDAEIMLARVGFSEILDEAVRMRAAYAVSADAADRSGDGVIRFAAPLAWAHAEVAVALLLLDARVPARAEPGDPPARRR